ncbi:glutamate--cysteine ligase [Microlunatus endophyticus]|uniref:Glutamate--cysteine ligase n=1 Tax=Microlunatus endophyticus TaxID=1716077 RepID=A0A917S2P0_9ACTN|nr:glutamate--cysteine ligase [Microlunatus endophyticus]GGL51097.1 glutamate--cysteine ligase [Microlunatus endophyticus]
MGDDVEEQKFTRADRTRHRERVRAGLDVLARMIAENRFEAERPMSGLEVELNLINDRFEPAMQNAQALAAISAPEFQTELGRFNLEINVPPRELSEGGLGWFEQFLRRAMVEADQAISGARLMIIGILPTLRPEHAIMENLSANPRYALLNDQVLQARGEDITISIDGEERLQLVSDSVMPEAACTSTQVHLQVSPQEFGAYWNAAQAIAGIQVAVGANSPFLFGRRLVDESRIPLFEQATDTRSDDLKAQGVRPRVWFGERWITSIYDLFEENSRYFAPLLPVISDEDPSAVLDAGGTPQLEELQLHNGTVYRWNRPVYDPAGGSPHLRVENRVLPAGPTVIDTVANAAFFAGLVRALAEADVPIWSELDFETAESNFRSGVRNGIEATVAWPEAGEVAVTDLVLRSLLPLAQDGLRRWQVPDAEADRLLTVIERRCLSHCNGATWQTAAVRRRQHAGADRDTALHQMVADYRELMAAGDPVHSWPVG